MLAILDCYLTLFAMSLIFCVSSVSKNFLEEKLMWKFLFALLSGTPKGYIKLLLSIFLVVNLFWFYFLISSLHKRVFITKTSIPLIPFTKEMQSRNVLESKIKKTVGTVSLLNWIINILYIFYSYSFEKLINCQCIYVLICFIELRSSRFTYLR